MATSTAPLSPSGFTQDWTVFYYAWFVAYAPFMSLFIAKISRGRTVRQVVGAGDVVPPDLGGRASTTEFTGQGGVYDIGQQHGLTLEQVKQVSDHLPVWMDLDI